MSETIEEKVSAVIVDPADAPLTELAAACHNGACNPIAIIHRLSDDIRGLSQDEVRKSIEVKIILGQLTYLMGESLGPTMEALEAYRQKNQTTQIT